MKIERKILKKEISERIEERLSKTSLFDTKSRIEEERERRKEEFYVEYDVLGITQKEYFLFGESSVFCYHTCLNSEFDKTTFQMDKSRLSNPQNKLVDLFNIFVDGLTTFLTRGFGALFIWLDDYKVSEKDFINESIEVDEKTHYIYKTLAYPRYVIFDKQKSINVDYFQSLFEFYELQINLLEREKISNKDGGLKIISGDEAMKHLEKMMGRMKK